MGTWGTCLFWAFLTVAFCSVDTDPRALQCRAGAEPELCPQPRVLLWTCRVLPTHSAVGHVGSFLLSVIVNLAFEIQYLLELPFPVLSGIHLGLESLLAERRHHPPQVNVLRDDQPVFHGHCLPRCASSPQIVGISLPLLQHL